MGEKGHINEYSASDIRRYLAGEMTPSEMRLLELRALQDPFLQDALDGYEEMHSQNPGQNLKPWLDKIRQLPTEEEENKKAAIIPIWRKKWLQYAVAATVIAGAGWTIFNLSQPDNSVVRQEKAAMVTQADSTSIEISPAPAILSPTTEPSAETPELQEAESKPAPIPSQSPKKAAAPAPPPSEVTSKSKEAFEDLDGETAKAEESATTVQDQLAPELAKTAAKAETAPPAAPSGSQKRSVDNRESAMVRSRLMNEQKSIIIPASISGVVTNEEQYPLDNIKLTLSGKINQVVVSDELGRFHFSLPENTEGLLTASGAGYKTKELKVKAGETFNIVLQKGEKSLSEMIVADYSKKKQGIAQTPQVDTSEAVPMAGWQTFMAYLQKEKKAITIADKKPIVVLSFEVDEKGRPENLEILESGGKAADAEAIRLIQNGPDWRNKTSSPGALVRVVVKWD